MRNESTVGALIVELKKLKLREAQIISLLERENERAETDDFSATSFATGDRVLIKNRVKKPATWSNAIPWDERVARNATVTGIDQGKVHFTTDNGVKTWRLPSNLKRL